MDMDIVTIHNHPIIIHFSWCIHPPQPLCTIPTTFIREDILSTLGNIAAITPRSFNLREFKICTMVSASTRICDGFHPVTSMINCHPIPLESLTRSLSRGVSHEESLARNHLRGVEESPWFSFEFKVLWFIDPTLSLLKSIVWYRIWPQFIQYRPARRVLIVQCHTYTVLEKR